MIYLFLLSSIVYNGYSCTKIQIHEYYIYEKLKDDDISISYYRKTKNGSS